MGYDLNEKNYSKELDLKKLKPYGDTMNDGKVQLSFTLPVKNDEKGINYPIHNPKFDVDEDALPFGSAVLAFTAIKYLEKS